MGWGSGILPDGREVGYNVAAVCERDDCDVDIDCGLAFVCGGMHEGGLFGCGHYFCDEHLRFTTLGQLCEACDEGRMRHCIVCRTEPSDEPDTPRFHLADSTHPKFEPDPAGIVCADDVDNLGAHIHRTISAHPEPFPGTSRELLIAAAEREGATAVDDEGGAEPA